MTWLYFLIYICAAFGLTFVVGFAKISLWLREKLAGHSPAGQWMAELLECPACLGTWTGFGFGAWVAAKGWSPVGLGWTMLVFGCFTCTSNLLLLRAVGLTQRGEQQP